MFPKITSNNLKGITGQAYFEYFVNEYLKCIYHPISEENDFGIDGYIELVINKKFKAGTDKETIDSAEGALRNQYFKDYR